MGLLCDCLRRILLDTASSRVPLGVSVESVSIFREEIDAAHDLFTQLQAIMLDAHGSPWKVQWVYTMSASGEERAVAAAIDALHRPERAAGDGRSPRGDEVAVRIEFDKNQMIPVLLALAVGFLIGSHRP